MRLRLYRDTRGRPHAEAPAPYQVLGQYLHSDIQSIPSRSQELIDTVDSVRSGHESEWKDVGNAFELHITPEGVRVKSLYLEPPQSGYISLEDFRQALVDWLAFIQS